MSTDPQAAPRPLPDRPNLRHLKDQAKDLVKAGTAKSVTDAQFQIARSYGFAELAEAQGASSSLWRRSGNSNRRSTATTSSASRR